MDSVADEGVQVSVGLLLCAWVKLALGERRQGRLLRDLPCQFEAAPAEYSYTSGPAMWTAVLGVDDLCLVYPVCNHRCQQEPAAAALDHPRHACPSKDLTGLLQTRQKQLPLSTPHGTESWLRSF